MKLSVLFLAGLWFLHAPSEALAQPLWAASDAAVVGGEGLALPKDQTLSYGSPSWSAYDQRRYRTNRRFAIAGKVLTVVGRLSLFGVLMAGGDFTLPEAWVSFGTAAAGELMWSGADLRATNQLRRRGLRIGRASAILSLLGALVFAPVTWVAGPIASGAIRRAHRSLGVARSPSASCATWSYCLRF